MFPQLNLLFFPHSSYHAQYRDAGTRDLFGPMPPCSVDAVLTEEDAEWVRSRHDAPWNAVRRTWIFGFKRDL